MTHLKCNTCDRIFSNKSGLKYHTMNEVCKKQQKYKCKYCPKTFAHKSGMYRHMNKSCEQKRVHEQVQDIDDDENSLDSDVDKKELLKMFKEMQQTIPKLQAQIDDLKTENTKLKTGSMVNNGTINNNTINGDVTNNIVLVGYGKEDMDRVDKIDILRGMKGGFNSTLNLIDAVHFNPKYPEYHNVYISSMKNKYAMMYDGNDWTLVMKDYLIDKLYDDKRDFIEENLEDFLESLTPSQVNALHRWMDGGDSHPYVQTLKNDIKLLLYNKRKMVIEPDRIDYHSDIRVIKRPKGNIIDPPHIRRVTVTPKVNRKIAQRLGTKRKFARTRR